MRSERAPRGALRLPDCMVAGAAPQQEARCRREEKALRRHASVVCLASFLRFGVETRGFLFFRHLLSLAEDADSLGMDSLWGHSIFAG